MTTTEHVWEPLPLVGYSCYEWCEPLGAVRSWKNNKWGRRTQPKTLRARKSAGGYYSWHLTHDTTGLQHNVSLHVLVCTKHNGPRPAGAHACHGDGNPENNSPDNLRWDSPQANVRDSVIHGVRRVKLQEEDVLKIRLEQGRTQAALAAEFDISQSMVSMIRSGARFKEILL